MTVAFEQTTVRCPPTAPDDPRIGRQLRRDVPRPDAVRAVLLGFPSDEGVRLNGGRPGAAEAPDAIRRALYRMTPGARLPAAFRDLLAQTADLGNLVLAERLEDSQVLLGQALAPYLNAGVLTIVLGGGHETAYGHFLGYAGSGRRTAVLNWDAHPDVRPLKEGRAHSGSPFRQAMEHPSGCCQSYTVAGLLPHSVARAHLDAIADRGGAWIWRDDLTEAVVDHVYAGLTGPAMVTFDLDAVDQAEAPGVSAPAVGGLPASCWLHAARSAGRSPHVASVDVVELNPRFDVDGRTTRLAALTVWQVLAGYAERIGR